MLKDSDIERRDEPLPETLAPGTILVETLYLSVDPTQRIWLELDSYLPAIKIGEVVRSIGVGRVLRSNAAGYSEGDVVQGLLGWQTHAILSTAIGGATKLPPNLPLTSALSLFGMTGLTAYFGLLDIGQPKEGETVVVSGAAGAVGITVCQLAKIKGCRVVGIAGSEDKNKYLRDELGVDEVINYKTENVAEALSVACPKRIDVYFDNVGGEISDAVMPLLNQGARIVLCGQISLYNLGKPDVGPRPQPYLLVNSALMKGFIIVNYAPRFAEGVTQLAQWLAAGKLKYAESIVEGFANTPQAFIGLFTGDNLGKQIVKVTETV